MTKMIFNARLQRETEHSLSVDNNNEIVALCTETGDFLKFPQVTENEFNVLIEKHKLANIGQIVKAELFQVPEMPAPVVREEVQQVEQEALEASGTSFVENQGVGTLQ